MNNTIEQLFSSSNSTLNNLIPAVIQDDESNAVLMIGYLNQEAWEKTCEDGRMHYFSRKKERIWLKGERSGHYQYVKSVFLNCDRTCLLFRVKQIGGACDQGYKTCFDKIYDGNAFRETGSKVFNPALVYGIKFTEEIRLGIPTGSLETMTTKIFKLGGYSLSRTSNRSYHPILSEGKAISFLMARAQELPIMVADGRLDLALTGSDLIEESKVSVRDLCDLGYNKLGRGRVMVALACPESQNVISVKDFEGCKIATAYPNITSRFFESMGVSVLVSYSAGATEGKVPLVANAIVELVESGETLIANGLKPVVKLFETSVHLIANHEAWSFTWKRKAMEEIMQKLLLASSNLPLNGKKLIDVPSLSWEIGRTKHE